MKKLFLILACLLLISGCGHVKLSNGENAVVTFDGIDAISSEDLYKALKKDGGTSKIITLIDTKLLNKLYETTSEEKNYIKDAVKTAKKNAKDAGAEDNFDLYLQYYYGLSNEEAFEDYLSLEYKRGLWVTDYAKESVNEKQLNEYYENVYFGDIDAKHILITIDAASDASSEEKTEAENKALEKANEVISKLKEGKSFDDLAKEYSKDKTTASKGGSLGKINVGDYDSDVVNALNNLEVGKYSETPVKSSYGYHILYKVSQDDKKELKDAEDHIRTVIGNEIKAEDGFNNKALKALREKYKTNFKDEELQKEYDKLMAQYE